MKDLKQSSTRALLLQNYGVDGKEKKLGNINIHKMWFYKELYVNSATKLLSLDRNQPPSNHK